MLSPSINVNTWIKQGAVPLLLTSLLFTTSNALAYSNDSTCDTNPEWFTSPVGTNPAEQGKDSPFAFVNGQDESTNCDFHQWSWNSFLKLTQEDDSAPGGLSMFGKGFWQVDNSLVPYFAPWNDLLNPTGLRPSDTLILEDVNQAGPGDPQIFGKYGNFPVHFSIHVNNTFMTSALEHPVADPKAEFSIGSLELKVAWMDLNSLEKILPGIDLTQYFYIRNAIYKSDNKYLGTMPAAMIGMHVVGVVENHPEFIWATFEHQMLAPDYYVSGDTFKKSTEYLQQDNIVSTTNSFLLYVTGSRVEQANLTYPAGETTTNSFRLYQYGVPNGNPYVAGKNSDYVGAPDQQKRDAENFNNIAHLNGLVRDKLTSENSIWRNYFYSGSIWLSTEKYNFANGISGSIVGSGANDSLRGSLAVANMSMETYTQTFSNVTGDNPQIKPANCFTCHGISKGKSTMQVSHIYDNFLKLNKAQQQAQE